MSAPHVDIDAIRARNAEAEALREHYATVATEIAEAMTLLELEGVTPEHHPLEQNVSTIIHWANGIKCRNEALRAAFESCNRARANAEQECDALRTENARLREALGRLARGNDCGCTPICRCYDSKDACMIIIEGMRSAAQDALRGGEGV